VLTSISCGLHPSPVVPLSASNPALVLILTELTSVHYRQDHTVFRLRLFVISSSADLLAAQRIGIWISSDLDRVVNGMADGDDGVCAARDYTAGAKSGCVVRQIAGVTDAIAWCWYGCDSE
jgi:hypothetical protein